MMDSIQHELDISGLIYEIVSMQFSIFTDLEHNSTQYVCKAAQYSEMAKQLEAKQELVQLVFSKSIEEQQRLYKSAHNVLDKAIEQGEIGLAETAMTVIKVAHAKKLI